MAPATAKVPSALESSLMSAILEMHSGPLNVDWDGVARIMGYKNGKVASDRFGQVKKKLGWGAGSTANQGTRDPGKVAKRAPAKARSSAVAARKPAAKKAPTAAKARGTKAKVQPKMVEYEEADDEESGLDGENHNRDLMAASDEEDGQEESFEEKFNRGAYDDDDEGQLSDGAVEELQRQIAEDELQRELPKQGGQEYAIDEYDAYDPDAVFEDAEDDQFEDAKEEMDGEDQAGVKPVPTIN